jgi:methanogenic corrinoid protein MtbC1
MTTIADLSDEPKYTIKVVCSRTGIRPVTLRAWERRHEILHPYRSDNRYRLYSDRDVAILYWLKNRVDTGVPISSAANEIRTHIKNGAWPEVVEPAATAKTVRTDVELASQFAARLYDALVAHQETKAIEIIREANPEFDLKTLFTRVFIPCLVEIGEAWYAGRIRISTEHFASSLIRGRILSILQTLPNRRSGAHILIGCAPDEQHEIGSLMLATLMRESGFMVEFLGPDLPIDDLVDYSAFETPDMIILSATLEDSALSLQHVQSRLNKIKNPPIFGFGGPAFLISPDLKHKIGGVYLGDTLDEAVVRVRQEVKQHRSKKA